jgi:hypothetical protein
VFNLARRRISRNTAVTVNLRTSAISGASPSHGIRHPAHVAQLETPCSCSGDHDRTRTIWRLWRWFIVCDSKNFACDRSAECDDDLDDAPPAFASWSVWKLS